jgi:hypothetical protein
MFKWKSSIISQNLTNFGGSDMKAVLYAIFAIFLLILSSCLNPSKSKDGLEKQRGLLTDRQQCCIDNINTTVLEISMAGPRDFTLRPLLFYCSSDANSQNEDFSIRILIKCDDLEKALYSVYSKSDKNIDPNEAPIGSYGFSIYNKKYKEGHFYIYDYETSMEILREIKNIVREDKNARKAISLYLGE